MISVPQDAGTVFSKHLTGSLVLAGAGKMGGALLDGWLGAGLAPARVVVFEPAPSLELLALTAKTGLRLNPEIGSVRDAVVMLLALKPQTMGQALPAFLPLVTPGAMVVSIAAGKTIRFFEQIFGADAAIVRAMPNLPAAVQRGITVLYPNSHVSAVQRALAAALLGSVGAVEWIEDEALLDPVTAVSGSGPAYVFLLIEALAKAGIEAGLNTQLANRLAVATVSGAGELAAQSALPASVLRENVTSPGGTTAAAMDILMGTDGLQQLLTRAVLSATRRSIELAD